MIVSRTTYAVRAALLCSVLLQAVPASAQRIPELDIPPSLHGDSLGDGGPAVAAQLVTPIGLARDAAGNIYISERGAHRIRRIDGVSGIITTIAGNGEAGFTGDGVPARQARLTQPDEITVDAAGNLLFGDVDNHRVRRIDARTGVITTIAGTGQPGFSGDGGPATAAQLNGPFGVALDSQGNIFITDTENQRIRRVDAVTGVITTIAGNGVWDYSGDGGNALQATFARPHRLLVEGDTALYIGDSFNFRIRRLDLRTGIIEHYAGTGLRGSSGDGGPARDAAFTYFGSLAFAPDGDLLVVSLAEHRIRRIDKETGIISTIAGTGEWAFGGDGGPATAAQLHMPLSLIVEPDGDILFTDMWNGRIRRIDARTNVITTVAGSAPSPSTPAVSFHFHYNRDSTRADLDRPVRYTLPGMERVSVQRNIAYRDAAHPRARFDVYAPDGASADNRAPVVFVVPGRSDLEIRSKDTAGFESWGRLLAASGMAAVVLDHSLGTRARALPEAADDLAAAMAYVRTHAAEYRADADRVCVLSFSTGSPLAAAAIDAADPALRCIAAYYPHVDLTRNDIRPWWQNIWLQEPLDARARYSLSRLLPETRVPTLLVRAGGDQSAFGTMHDSLRSALGANTSVTFLQHPSGSSGFERIIDDADTHAIVRSTLCFLQQHLALERSQCVADEAPAGADGNGGPATAAPLDRPLSLALDDAAPLLTPLLSGSSGEIRCLAAFARKRSCAPGSPSCNDTCNEKMRPHAPTPARAHARTPARARSAHTRSIAPFPRPAPQAMLPHVRDPTNSAHARRNAGRRGSRHAATARARARATARDT